MKESDNTPINKIRSPAIKTGLYPMYFASFKPGLKTKFLF